MLASRREHDCGKRELDKRIEIVGIMPSLVEPAPSRFLFTLLVRPDRYRCADSRLVSQSAWGRQNLRD